MNCQNMPSSRCKMTLCCFEVCVGGMTHAFGPDCFLHWLQGEEDTSAVICIRGVPVRGGAGSEEVTDFFCQELRLAEPPGRWQKRTLWYLKNRCGHRFLEEGAVCQAREEISAGDEMESHCKRLKFQVHDTFIKHVGTRSPTHLLILRPGHQIASPDSGLKSIQFFWDSRPYQTPLSPAPAAAAATAAEANISPTVLSGKGSNKDPRASLVWTCCFTSAVLVLVSPQVYFPSHGRQEEQGRSLSGVLRGIWSPLLPLLASSFQVPWWGSIAGSLRGIPRIGNLAQLIAIGIYNNWILAACN